MGSMLKDILEAEKKARSFSLEAEKYKADAAVEVERIKKQMTDAKLAEAHAVVESLREEHKRAVAASMKSAEDNNRAVIEQLNRLENEKFDEWVDAVVCRVVENEE